MAAKWGRGNLTEKFYTGSSKSNPWVKDLLWKLYIQNEGKLLRIPGNEHIDSLPAHMQSVAFAGINGRQMLREADATLVAKEHYALERSASEGSFQGGYASARSSAPRTYRSSAPVPQSDYYGEGSARVTARSRNSSRETERQDAAARRLKLVQKMLAQEQATRKGYERELQSEKAARARAEREMKQLKGGVSQNLNASRNAREKNEAKLKAYQEIMGTLVNALDKNEKTKSRRRK